MPRIARAERIASFGAPVPSRKGETDNSGLNKNRERCVGFVVTRGK